MCRVALVKKWDLYAAYYAHDAINQPEYASKPSHCPHENVPPSPVHCSARGVAQNHSHCLHKNLQVNTTASEYGTSKTNKHTGPILTNDFSLIHRLREIMAAHRWRYAFLTNAGIMEEEREIKTAQSRKVLTDRPGTVTYVTKRVLSC